MLIKINCEIVVKSSMVCSVEVPLSVKQLRIKDNEVDSEVLSAKDFRAKVSKVYAEKRSKANNEKMPELPTADDQVLCGHGMEYDDEDNVLAEIKSHYARNQNLSNIYFKLRSKSDTSDGGKSIFDSYQLLGGSLSDNAMFVALHVQPQDLRIVCFRPQSSLVQLLRNGVLQNDERLYQAIDKQHNSYDYNNKKSGVSAFGIRFRLSEFMRHTHLLSALLPKKKKRKANKTGIVGEDDDDEEEDDDDDDEEDDLLSLDTDEAPQASQGLFGSTATFGGGSTFRTGGFGSKTFGGSNNMAPETLAELKALVKFMEAETKSEHEKWAAVFKDGMATFDSLAFLLRVGTKVVATTREGHLQGGRVKSIEYQQSRFGAFWAIQVESATTDGHSFLPRYANVSIRDFAPKMMEISELPIRPMNDEQLKFLNERGAVYRKLAIGSHHLSYIGPIKINALRHVRADGRVMVDEATHAEHNPDGQGFGGRSGRKHASIASDAFSEQEAKGQASQYAARNGQQDDKESWDPLSDNLLFMCPPSLKAFSFRLHTWGDAYVVQMSEIEFREKAFEQLVLPEEQKQLIRAMVVNTRSQAEVDALARKQWSAKRLVVHAGDNDADDDDEDHADKQQQEKAALEALEDDDFISNKGGGCIFLLSGSPGTGKTLTAEAVAEVLKLPLYCVTVGELGTTASELEDRLRYVLDLAATWNCCILLDEADVFLSKRNDDVVRSGLVSIFLRVIEYHQGVLFLTSNRKEEIDPAFASRINIALNYEPLGPNERSQVWANFLEGHVARGMKFDTDSLAVYPLNGRQIRSVYRVALAMSRDKKETLSQHTIEIAIKHSMQL